MKLHFETETAEMNLDFTKYFCGMNWKREDKTLFKAMIETFGTTPEEINEWFAESEKEVLSTHEEEWWKKYLQTPEHKALDVLRKSWEKFKKTYKLEKKEKPFIKKMNKMKFKGLWDDEPVSADDGVMIVWAHCKDDKFIPDGDNKFKRMEWLFKCETELVGYADEGKKFVNLALSIEEVEAVKFFDGYNVSLRQLKKIAPFLDKKSTINFYRSVGVSTNVIVFTCSVGADDIEFLIATMNTESTMNFTELGGVNIL